MRSGLAEGATSPRQAAAAAPAEAHAAASAASAAAKAAATKANAAASAAAKANAAASKAAAASDDVRGCPIRQHHEPKAKIFMDVPAQECIHLVTPRTDGGYVFLG